MHRVRDEKKDAVMSWVNAWFIYKAAMWIKDELCGMFD